MRKTLEALYYGNIHPTETPPDKSSSYWKVSKKANQAYDQVQEILTEGQRYAFDEFVSLQLSCQAEAEAESFIRGFRLGARLVTESLIDSDFVDAVSSFE